VAACLLALSNCSILDGHPVLVEPDPAGFGREYPEDFAAAGRAIAQDRCASCHAIDQQTKSPRPDAPPFRMLLQFQSADRLADNLIAGNRVGHDGMPAFDFNVIAADSLLAYLEAIAVGSERNDVGR
jgi:mono/diheme cytochrome c family protein